MITSLKSRKISAISQRRRCLGCQAGVPVPTFSSAIAYFDSYRAERLPANIIQAQRDYFGAHTYERVDKEGIFHYSWYHEE